jgi:sugar/nucleoside kinase (ribokinase family)
MRRGVVSGGCILVDVNKSIDHYPAEERLAMIKGESAATGGPGLNLPIDLAKLGAPFPLEVVGVVGDDLYGQMVRDVCRKAGIGTEGLGVLPGVRTSYTDVMIVKENGRRTFFHHQGANAKLLPAQFDFSRTQARILHIGSPGMHEAMDRPTATGNGFTDVLIRARAAGLRTNMEMVTFPPEQTRALVRPCLPLLDTIVINELEAAALAEIDTHRDGAPDFDRAEAAARRLVELGVSQLAVVHFPAGCVAAAPGGRTFRHGSVRVPPEDVKSTNGAGDAFASGVMLGVHEGWPVERCLEAGVCVAAVSLGDYSTSGAIRPIGECLAYGRRHGFRETARG